MKRPLRALLTVVGLVVVCAPLRADTLLLDRFRDYVESLRVQGGIPGLSAAIIGTNDVIWERAFGQQDVERSIATRTDTPFHFDGLTEVFTASLVLRCVEEGHLSLDDRIGQFTPDAPDANATIRQILSHTSGASDNLVFSYRPDRLDPLSRVIRVCMKDSFRKTNTLLLDRLAMIDSVPGPDMVRPELLTDGVPTPEAVERYASVLARLATPYAVDARGRPSRSQYLVRTLTPAGGLMSTVRDYVQFDLALKGGLLLRAETLAAAWQPPVARNGLRLPHGLGWFVQGYNGETIVWQFGMGENASSSLILTVPARGLTLILLANSNGLVKPFPLASGDVIASPFARLFLELFVR